MCTGDSLDLVASRPRCIKAPDFLQSLHAHQLLPQNQLLRQDQVQVLHLRQLHANDENSQFTLGPCQKSNATMSVPLNDDLDDPSRISHDHRSRMIRRTYMELQNRAFPFHHDNTDQCWNHNQRLIVCFVSTLTCLITAVPRDLSVVIPTAPIAHI